MALNAIENKTFEVFCPQNVQHLIGQDLNQEFGLDLN